VGQPIRPWAPVRGRVTVKLVRSCPDPDPDPLAVRTRVEGGEEIAYGEPSVTDQERAAAGRETIAERSRSLLADNQRRAAELYAAATTADADEPDADQVTRVWYPREAGALRSRLGDATLAVWAEDDILHVLWKGEADEVHLGTGVQPPMWPVPGSDDLWEASLRIRRLAEAVISIVVFPRRAGQPELGQPSVDHIVWRGPRAPTLLPAAEPLAGAIDDHTIDSAALGASRGLTVYRPPGSGQTGPLPACVVADGQSVHGFARILEPAILTGAVPATVLVGVHSVIDPAAGWPDPRSREYLPRHDRRRFNAHLRFVVGEVIPWATRRLGVAATPWLVAGYSNGAAWSIAAAQRRPDLFAGVAAFSAGVVPRQITSAARTAGVRHYLAAGTLEPGFRQSTRQWAERLQRAGLPCRHHEWVGGHDNVWWEQELPAALGWLLAPP
jgi:enterochelin esterase-like enzyme